MREHWMENKTEQNCLISVIVPVYNILDCLERCVNSICAQTWKNLEILLVDDGSTDGTGKLCDLLAEKDDRIRVFHKPNGGSSSARNLGISMAKGKWIGFVDSDDWIEPQMYERLYEAATAAGTSIAQASRDEIDEDYHKRPDVCTPPEQEVTCTAEDFLKTLLLHQGDCSFCTKLIKKSLFEGHRLTMVNIWATFCNPCLSEMPELGELAAEYAKEEGGVQIIGICTDITDLSGNTTQEAVDGAKQIVEMTGAAYPHLIPNDEFMAFLMQEVPGVPTTFFVDENGEVIGDEVVGAKSKDAWQQEIESRLAMLES